MSIARARELRKYLTDAERHLWNRLRNRQLGGYRFRRQVPLGRYIIDFVCHDRNVAVELDGGHHANQVVQDSKRDQWLTNEGFRVLRFWNNEVFENLDGVTERMLQSLDGP